MRMYMRMRVKVRAMRHKISRTSDGNSNRIENYNKSYGLFPRGIAGVCMCVVCVQVCVCVCVCIRERER